jgi:hypothetical protein
MRAVFLTTAVWSLLGCQSVAPVSVAPVDSLSISNPGFEKTSEDSSIPGWELSQHIGKWDTPYEMTIDKAAGPGGSPALRVTRLHEEVYGSVRQTVPIAPGMAGRKLKFSASMKSRDVGAEGWLLVITFTSHGRILRQFKSPPVTGTTDWHSVDIVGTIPNGTSMVDIGFLLLDGGTGWADNARLSIE